MGDADSRDGKSYARLRGDQMDGRLRDTRVTSQGPPWLQLASVQQDGSFERALLFIKQKEAAASI
jgi:hypothetical protein